MRLRFSLHVLERVPFFLLISGRLLRQHIRLEHMNKGYGAILLFYSIEQKKVNHTARIQHRLPCDVSYSMDKKAQNCK